MTALLAAMVATVIFVILQLDNDFGERIPLTIADADPAEGTITIIFQAVGKTTRMLAAKGEGDRVKSVLGPLGRPTHIEKFGTALARLKDDHTGNVVDCGW